MMNQKSYEWGSQPSSIRALAMYGWERAQEIGAENVFDFSIGNPSTPPPESVQQTLRELLAGDPVALHSYSTAAGDFSARQALCDDLNVRFQAGVGPEHMYLTSGAAAALCSIFHGLFSPGDEIITLAPYFPEYDVFAQMAGVKLIPVAVDSETFEPDFCALAMAFNGKTRGLLINSPNNPTGIVYTAETAKQFGALLARKSTVLGNTIYLISDEPYRELVYEGEASPWFPHYYDNTIVCYSYSKSLSLPGARIGYFLVPASVQNHEKVYLACIGAGRGLGYVCAPTLFQRAVAACAGQTSDLTTYEENWRLLAPALREMGYQVAPSRGAFYLFVKAPGGDAMAFSERCKARDVLVVPSDSFGLPGFVRISYCVPKTRIERALPMFEQIIKECEA